MRLYSMRLFLACISTLFLLNAASQSIIISGSNHVTPGTTVTYTVSSWPSGFTPNANTLTDWFASGGSVVSQTQSSCQVKWNTGNFVGTVGLSATQPNPNPGQPSTLYSGSLNVQSGNPTITVSPTAMSLDYGSLVAQPLTANIATVDAIASVKWQSLSGGTWSDISTGNSYTPSSTANGTYRAAASIGGTWYYSDAVSVTLNPLDPGTISLSQQPAYNAVPVITYTASHGGTCAQNSRTYVWEQSIDGEPWTTIGTGVAYPSSAVAVAKASIRRKVTCNGVTLSSNILYISPTYTSVDYENLNYVRTIDVRIPGVINWYQADQLSVDSKFQSTTYLDGLGRPMQKVAKSASYSNNAWVDMVKPLYYDEAGRSPKDYLPYATSLNPGKFKTGDVSAAQAAFVQAKFSEPATAPTYTQTNYDNSPLNRVTSGTLPGQGWVGTSTQTAYDFNTVDESVHIWNLAYITTPIPTTTTMAVYPTGTLSKVIGTDEKGKQVITYTDFTGNVILKKVQEKDDAAGGLTNQHGGWVCTYYVYDDLNQLRFTITPKAVAYLDLNNWGLTQAIVDDLCFVYGYDAKGRTISEKQPGVGEIDFIYDQRDRLVFSQDANGKINNQWQVSLYDLLDRTISTGVLNQNISQSSLQTYVDANTGKATITTVTTTSGVADINATPRQVGRLEYVATNSITFNPEFICEAGATFIAYINPNLGNITREVVPIADNPLPSANYVALTQHYYDDYTQATKTYTTADNSLFDAATNANALALPSQISPMTRGMATTTKVKIISNPADLSQGTWLETDQFYDVYGRVIQVQNDNSLGGVDITTNRYDFEGKNWGTCLKQTTVTPITPTQFTVVSKNTYDARGRLTTLAKNFNSTFFKDLASYTYDEYGKLLKKRLAPGYTGSGKTEMEALNYSYNIQGWLTGINKDYALSTNQYSQWDQFFGLYLGYDDYNNQFSAKQFNGGITGAIWKSQGDNTVRKYVYNYDNLGRLTSAIYQQRKTPADTWSNSNVDLSEYIDYKDGNGNIWKMKHMGIIPGTNGGVVVDNLTYTYGTTANPNSNKLTRVDETSGFASNGQLKDFKDGSNAAGTDDYSYDNNGNLIQDQNKGIAAGAIVYNYQNKVVKVTVAGKSMVEYTYDATGTKLSKKVTNLAVTPNTSTTTQYADEFVYQDNVLQFVLHEEGRLKIITSSATSTLTLNAGTAGANNVGSGKQGVFEYFIKDQLSNTRMVLTEEVQKETYIATVEDGDANVATNEAKLFGKVDPTTGAPTTDNELILTRANRPTAQWTSNTSNRVTVLTASDPTKKVGPNLILKVSAGDMINAYTDYYYATNDATGSSNGVSDALTSLMGALLGNKTTALSKANSTLIQTNLSSTSGSFYSFINGHPSSGSATAPKAFLNIVFFDEQFNFIAPDASTPTVGSSYLRVASANTQGVNLPMSQKAPKNGWVYIYLSNESNQNVYFDNFSVSQDHGRISEENHYYAFGQKIAGICTSAFNKLPNKFNYQGDYSEDEDVTGWNEFDLRMYDPQIGRWTGADPYDQFANPYIGMGNDPINNIDPDGGWAGWEGALAGALAGGVTAYLAADNNSNNKGKFTFGKFAAGVGGALIGAGLGYSIEMSISSEITPLFKGSPNLWENFKAFYAGLFDLNGGYPVLISPGDHQALVPNIWEHAEKAVMKEEDWTVFTRADVGGFVRIPTPFGFNPPPPPPPDDYIRKRRVIYRVPFEYDLGITTDFSYGSWTGRISEEQADFADQAIGGIRSKIRKLGGGTLIIQSTTITMTRVANVVDDQVVNSGYESFGKRGLTITDFRTRSYGTRSYTNNQLGLDNLKSQAHGIINRATGPFGRSATEKVFLPFGNSGIRILVRGELLKTRWEIE